MSESHTCQVSHTARRSGWNHAGETNLQIAKAIGYREQDVKHTTSRLLKMFQVRDRLQLALRATCDPTVIEMETSLIIETGSYFYIH